MRSGSRLLVLFVSMAAAMSVANAQTDWPAYGHDAGGMQYSPLKQIDTSNVTKLKIAWTYDTRPATPLVVGGVMYLSTPYNRVVALEPETGKKIWETELEYTPSGRGIAYYPGDGGFPPQLLVGTMNGLVFIGATIDSRFRAIDAKTGKELWTTKLVDAAKALPITYQGKNGKQYVAILAGGGENRSQDNPGGRLYVFALP